MEWLNEPASWQRTGDVLTVSVDPGTDFWRETGYGYIRDSGHVYGEVLAGDLDVSVRIRGVLAAQYDQAGVMLRADEQTWLKTGIEFFEGRPRLSTVLTLGRSSWMVTDLPAGLDDILLRVSRRGDAVEVRYLIGEGQAELAALVYMPPDAQVLAGVMAAAPEGPGFRISFHDLHVTERDWSTEAGDDVAAGDWAGESAWAGDGGGSAAWPLDEGPVGEDPLVEAGADAWSGGNGAPSGEPSSWEGQEPAPAWDSGQPESGQPEGDRPGWASGPASEDHPSWPAGGTPLVSEADWLASIPEEDDPDWPKKLAMEDDPDWPKKLAMEDEPSWATEIGAAESGAAESKDGGPSGDSGTGAAESKDSGPSGDSGSGAAEPEDSDTSWAFGTGAAESKDSGPSGDSGSGMAEPEDSDTSWAFGSGAAEPKDSGPSGDSGPGAAPAKDSDAGWAAETGTDVSKDTGPGWAAGTSADAAKDNDPGQAGGPATEEGPGGAQATDHVTGPAGPATGPEPPLPGQPTETGRQSWAPAPTLADAVADWDRLAAGVQPGSQVVHAERWTAQVDADVANEWPGPPLRAARLAAISGGLTPRDLPGPAPAAPGSPAGQEPGAPAEPATPAQPGPPDSSAKGEPADGQAEPGQADSERADSEQAPAAPGQPGRIKRRKAATVRPPLDLPGPPDPADEWISLLTADPADE
jgi:regulation of enolase protein 1 (concanavalin A-like superfamily)